MIVPANDWRAKRQIVRSLIQAAREKIDIRHAYFDREFYQVHVVRELKKLDVEFIIRANPGQRMKDRLSVGGGETVVDEYEMRRNRPPAATAMVTMFAVPHTRKKKVHIWFVTNLDVTNQTVYAYAQTFRRRWGIETSYRKITDFLPKTSATTFSVRLFYFSLAATLYNLWVLVNLFVWPSVPRPQTPPISAGLFQHAISIQLSRQESGCDDG
jgi:phosphatidylserine/phosphatidylglycerophosphate/cardiolipin synthase-like enzyme